MAENTVPYKGTEKLPHCQKCLKGKAKDHTLMTYEHPYRMKTDEELKGGEK